MEILLGLLVFSSGIGVGWMLRGYRSLTLDELARIIDAAERDEPIAERVRRANSK